MHQADCNRLFVSPQYPAVTEPGDDCTTQSGIPLFDHTADELSYISSPASQITETTEPVLTPTSDQPPGLPSADIASYSPHLQLQVSYSSTPSVKGAYLLPSTPEKPTLPFEVVDDISHLDSPIIPTQAFPSGIHYHSGSTAGSPMSWPAPGVFHPQFTWDRPDSHPNQHVGAFTPTFDDQLTRHMPPSAYGDLTDLQLNQSMESGFPGHSSDAAIAPGLISQSPDIPVPEAPPQPKEEMKASFPPDEGENAQNLIAAPAEQAEADDGASAAEPYAKLIFKAFMSRDSHAMTLQEIYQWFRENTEKAKSESKGWQNSIRHNLSMNGAFVKRDRNAGAGDLDSQETKKSTEWVLEEWAVLEGVQSTTRYRRGNPNRRSGSASHHRSQGSSSARAPSGRRSGISSSKSKSAGARRSALNRTTTHNPFHGHNLHGATGVHGGYGEHHSEYQAHDGQTGASANFSPYHPSTYRRQLEYHYTPSTLSGHAATLDMSPASWAVRTSSHPATHGGMSGYVYTTTPSQSITDIQHAHHTQYSLGNMEAAYPLPQQITSHAGVTSGMVPMSNYGSFFSNSDDMDSRGLVWDNTTSGEREYH